MSRRGQDAPRSFSDDGLTVALDVHGCTVDGALGFIRGTLALASRRGRSQVDVIHGVGGAIEFALRDALAGRELAGAESYMTVSGRTVIGLRIGAVGDPRRIVAADLR
ncbi:MAG: hypothetical protein ACI9W4_000454 [Rhodothermales bacterium]|jgi:hypothetical protein